MRETRYRFLGRTNPAERTKIGVKAELMTGEQDAGVAKMYLYDAIDSYGGYWGVSAREFIEALADLGPDVEEIRLHINSPGGEVFEGIAIMNTLRNHKAKVVGVVDGLAASAASFIAASLDELVMGPNSELMIHDAWGIAIGPAEDMRDMANRLDALSDNIASVYARKGGGSAADWRAPMLAETWYSAEESVSAGLADRVDGADTEPAENSFDIEGMFTYPGRAAAPGPTAIAPPPPAPDARPITVDYLSRHRAHAHALRSRRMAS